jgi:hypothetical protein
MDYPWQNGPISEIKMVTSRFLAKFCERVASLDPQRDDQRSADVTLQRHPALPAPEARLPALPGHRI